MDVPNDDNPPIYIPKDAIVEAYRSNNPVETLQGFLESVRITYADVDSLLMRVWHTKSPNFLPSHPQHDMQTLINQFYESDASDWSDEGFKSRLVFFATSVVHIWGHWKDETFHLTNIREPIAAYARANAPIPYVWFHAQSNGAVVLLKHNFRVRPDPLKVLQTTMRAANSMKMEHCAYDLATNRRIKSTRNGSFLNLVLRQDHGGFLEIPQSGACGTAEFVVVLTFGDDFEVCNIYYNQRQPKKIWALNCIAHEA